MIVSQKEVIATKTEDLDLMKGNNESQNLSAELHALVRNSYSSDHPTKQIIIKKIEKKDRFILTHIPEVSRAFRAWLVCSAQALLTCEEEEEHYKESCMEQRCSLHDS